MTYKYSQHYGCNEVETYNSKTYKVSRKYSWLAELSDVKLRYMGEADKRQVFVGIALIADALSEYKIYHMGTQIPVFTKEDQACFESVKTLIRLGLLEKEDK